MRSFNTIAALLLAAGTHAQATEKQDIYISVILPFAPLGFESVIFGNVPSIQTSYVLQKYIDKLNADPKYHISLLTVLESCPTRRLS